MFWILSRRNLVENRKLSKWLKNTKMIESPHRQSVLTWRNSVLKIGLTTDLTRNKTKMDDVLNRASSIFVIKTNIQTTWFRVYYFYYCSFAVLSLMCFMNIVEHKNGKFGIAFSYSVMLWYLLWFINSVFQGAAECAPYEFSKLL